MGSAWNFLTPRPERRPEPGSHPSFSVIITAYQAAAWIGEAIESVLAQTRPAHEIIVCDDGSTDELLDALAGFRDEITLIRQDNRGEAAAKNAAAAAASGEFVSILDADDVFLPHYLEAVSELAAERPDLDILTTDAYLELDGRVTGRFYADLAKFVVGDQRRGALHNHFIFGLASVRRSRWLSVGGFDETILNPDTDFFLRAILAGAHAGLVDAPLAIYRLRHGSLSANHAVNMRAELSIFERAREDPSLTADEREYLERQLEVKRGETLLISAADAVAEGAPDARRHALALAFGDLPPGFGTRTRLKALAAAASPRLARRVLRRPGAASILRTGTRGR
jgi:glycosyltransferase involved in cell wall biosynthesis